MFRGEIHRSYDERNCNEWENRIYSHQGQSSLCTRFSSEIYIESSSDAGRFSTSSTTVPDANEDDHMDKSGLSRIT